MLNFDEWDLVRLATLAGFETVIANLSLNILPGIPTRWEDFIAFQANPNPGYAASCLWDARLSS
jgi:hypothetical protein